MGVQRTVNRNPAFFIIAFVLLGIAFGWAAQTRRWSNRSGDQIEAELVQVEGDRVILRTPEGRLYRVPIESLSDEDRDFVRAAVAPRPAPGLAVPTPAPEPPPDVAQAVEIFMAAPVTEADFMRVMRQSCLRCHKACESVDSLVEKRWVRPGRPDRSPVFTIIGKHKKPDGKYHDLSESDRQIIHDFVKGMDARAQ